MPENNTHTHIEREKTSGSGAGIAFIVGGLVVAVAVIAWAIYGFGPEGEAGGGDVNISVEDGGEALESAAESAAGAAEEAAGAAENAAESAAESASDDSTSN